MTNDNNKQQLLFLEALFKRYYKPLRSYAFRFVNNKDLSEDIVQDVFFELWNKKEYIRFEEENSVKSYLFKSVFNRSVNILNSGYLKDSLPLEETSESQIIEHYLVHHLENQERSLLLKELKIEIAEFVDMLPPQCKKIFILSRTHNLKNKEIAEKLGISIKAVEKQITKAVTELRKHLLKKDLLFILYLFHQIF